MPTWGLRVLPWHAPTAACIGESIVLLVAATVQECFSFGRQNNSVVHEANANPKLPKQETRSKRKKHTGEKMIHFDDCYILRDPNEVC